VKSIIQVSPWYLSLGQVVKLHTTNPELFAWCR
jgi:hypothetical protein